MIEILLSMANIVLWFFIHTTIVIGCIYFINITVEWFMTRYMYVDSRYIYLGKDKVKPLKHLISIESHSVDLTNEMIDWIYYFAPEDVLGNNKSNKRIIYEKVLKLPWEKRETVLNVLKLIFEDCNMVVVFGLYYMLQKRQELDSKQQYMEEWSEFYSLLNNEKAVVNSTMLSTLINLQSFPPIEMINGNNDVIFRRYKTLYLMMTDPYWKIKTLFMVGPLRFTIAMYKMMGQFWFISFPKLIVHNFRLCYNAFIKLCKRWRKY